MKDFGKTIRNKEREFRSKLVIDSKESLKMALNIVNSVVWHLSMVINIKVVLSKIRVREGMFGIMEMSMLVNLLETIVKDKEKCYISKIR